MDSPIHLIHNFLQFFNGFCLHKDQLASSNKNLGITLRSGGLHTWATRIPSYPIFCKCHTCCVLVRSSCGKPLLNLLGTHGYSSWMDSPLISMPYLLHLVLVFVRDNGKRDESYIICCSHVPSTGKPYML